MHIKTDVFCAGSIILPDKGGRQINVGGWSLDSTFGVRLFTPDGVPGVNSTNDWEEDFHVLALQVNALSLSLTPNNSVLARPLVSYGCYVGQWNNSCHWWRNWQQCFAPT